MPPVNIMKDEHELIPTRASLLDRLKDWQDETSWKVFFDTYWKLIYNAACGEAAKPISGKAACTTVK